jgi:pSer/pThr/pTyr-binding forkhead associated (FHA) protein
MTDVKTAERPTRREPFAAPHVFVLAVVDGADVTAVHRIAQAETVIGRGDGADFQVDDDQVSTRHCLIRIEGPVCTLVELGSLNGTHVNARRVPSRTAERLRHLDTLQVGGTRILLLSGRFAERPPPAAG